jgi:hypothetical protein
MQVNKVIEMLSKLDPDEEIAFTGYWVRSDVEHNNDIKFTDDEWQVIVDKHERNTALHIDDVVYLFLREEL